MIRIWNFITNLGLGDRHKDQSIRNIIIANRINFIMFVFLLLLNIITAIVRHYKHGEYTIHTQKLLVLLVICVLNFVFSYYKKHTITKLSLIFAPSFIIVIFPILLGYVQEVDFVFLPLTIIAFSFVLQLVEKPELSNKLYLFSLLYFSFQIIFLDNLIVYFSGNDIGFFKIIDGEIIYYKIVIISVFFFIQSTMYYLRNLNYKYEIELQEQNEELKTTIETLQTTQKQLIQSEKMASLGVLTAGVAHEINNPLNFINGGILGLESYFKENLNDHIESVSPLIEAIQVGVKRAADIVTSLNHYSRHDDLPHTICDINLIIENCLIMLHNQIKNKVLVRKNYTDITFTLKGSEGKLHQALLNIIGNAAQSIEEQGEILINTEIVGRFIFIRIQDSGVGISHENLGKIYDPFFTTKEPGKGTGLGLSITSKIIQEHEGFLEIESELGKGTKATIKLLVNIKN